MQRAHAVKVSRALHSRKGRLDILANILQAYTKIRKLVQAARAAKQRSHQLVDTLMKSCSWQDTVVMQEICHRLKQKKRTMQPWGNVAKKHDKLYKLLAASVTIKSTSDAKGIDAFVRESFRCRALCVVSSRFGRRGALPSNPVPGHAQPYRVYGYANNDTCKRKHNLWGKEYQAWRSLPKLKPYTKRLTERMLTARCSVGAFVRLQILTDVCVRLGCAWVRLPTGTLGTGVHFGDGILTTDEIAEIQRILNARRHFRRIWGSAITLPETGHLVCEARQHVWKNKSSASMTSLMKDMMTWPSMSNSSCKSQRLSRKRRLCESVADYACQRNKALSFGRKPFTSVRLL